MQSHSETLLVIYIKKKKNFASTRNNINNMLKAHAIWTKRKSLHPLKKRDQMDHHQATMLA
jgi:hypothetical protein